MTQKDSDLQKIEKIISKMKDNELVEVEIIHGEDKILLKRAQPQQTVVSHMPFSAPAMGMAACAPVAQEKVVEAEVKDNLVDIKSPIVGTFYATPSPDADPYVEVGSNVSGQTIVCIVEAMKVMNEIKAETSGTVSEICVKSGEAVEYGQVLFRVKPN